MDRSIFKFILRFSLRQQIMLLAVTAVSMPLLYLSLELPKTIINEALNQEATSFNFFGVETERLDYLFMLSGLFLLLVFMNGGIKYFINVYRGVMAERMLRRLRYMLLQRLFRFPQNRFRTTSSGEIVAMVVQETEPVGGFFGEAFSLPAFQGGTLLTILTFMFIQDPILGLAAISLYPAQAYLIPKLQRRVNALAKQRVATARKLSERIGESVEGVRDVHLNGTVQYELSDFGARLGTLFDIRRRIYLLKFLIKFINNFLNQLTPFFFYSIGGYLVIEGDLTLGALVAILAAYKDISAPWKELLSYYQRKEDTRIKYEQVVEQFDPSDILDDSLIEYNEEAAFDGGAGLMARNVTLAEEDGRVLLNGVTLDLPPDMHSALIGPPSGGRTELLQALARLISPTRGQIRYGDRDMRELSDLSLGREIAYLDQDAFIRTGTIGDNLFYGLMQGPPAANDDNDKLVDLNESKLSGNSLYLPDADWKAKDIGGSEALTVAALRTLRNVDLEEDVFSLGLRRVVDPAQKPEFSKLVLDARKLIHAQISESVIAEKFDVFRSDAYNISMSVGENIIFGKPKVDEETGQTFSTDDLVFDVIEKAELTDHLIAQGAKVAVLLADIFRDLPPGHEFFERFNFFDPEDLAEYRSLATVVAEKQPSDLPEEGRRKLLSLVLALIPAKHRLGVIDESTQDRLLVARRYFANAVKEQAQKTVEFYDIDAYNSAGSVEDNILFGRAADSDAETQHAINEFLVEAAERIGLFEDIVEIGLEFDVGVGGKRLSAAQKQKIAIARSLLKKPTYLLLNDALSVFDAETRRKVARDIRSEMAGRGLLYAASEVDLDPEFDKVIHVSGGRISTDGIESSIAQTDTPTSSDAANADEAGSELREEAEVLKQIPFFHGMSHSDLMLLAFSSERVRFPESAVLMRQGELGSFAYVILSGEADVLVMQNGSQTNVSIRRSGELVGEIALLTDSPRTATLHARTDMEVLRINRDIFVKMIEDSPQLSSNLLTVIARRFESMVRGFTGGAQLYDSETRLPNAVNLFHRMDEEIASGALTAIEFSFPNLDQVIDAIGASTEARFFKKVTRRIAGAFGDSVMLSRIRRDCFVVVVREPFDAPVIQSCVGEVQKALIEPMIFGAQSYELPPAFLIINPLSMKGLIEILKQLQPQEAAAE